MEPEAIPFCVRELVWAKVRKELSSTTKTLYIAPDVALCRLPWAALPGDRPGRILLEELAVATLPHGGFLLDQLWGEEETDQRVNTRRSPEGRTPVFYWAAFTPSGPGR